MPSSPWSAAATLGRWELSLLLCGTLMRAATWRVRARRRLAPRHQQRPLPTDTPTAKITALAAEVKNMLLTATESGGPLFGKNGPLASAAGWTDAFRRAGQALGVAARDSVLQRGLREIISYLVIFHWNRLGLHVRTQSILASAACAAIL